MMRRGVLALGLGPLACAPYELPPIELDIANNCAAVRVDTAIDGLVDGARPWSQVVAAVVDVPRRPRLWMLAIQGGAASPYVSAIHLDETEAIDAVVAIDVPAALAGELSLVAGSAAGEAWVVQSGVGLLRLWHLDARTEPALVGTTDTLDYFPGQCDDDRDGQLEFCDTSQWVRAIVHIDDTPYLLAVPPSSPDTTFEIWLGALVDIGLQPVGQRLLVVPRCESDDPEYCQANAQLQRFSTIALAGIAREPTTGTTHLALYRELETIGVPLMAADVAIASLVLTPIGTAAVQLRTGPGLPEPAGDGARSIAADPWASYAAYDPEAGAAQLVRAHHDDVVDLATLMTPARGDRLIQLDDDIALAAIEDGAWRVTKVFPDAPERSQTTVFAGHDAIVDVRGAGPGSFVIHYADQTADLVEVACESDGAS